MLKHAATKLAHSSTLPALGNKDLKPLQDLITAEKTVLVSLRKLSADLTKAADALKSWAVGEGDELTDILNASTELVNYFSTALCQYSSYQYAMREHMKAVRDREEALDDLKRRQKVLVSRTESAEKRMEKISTDNRSFAAQNESLNHMRAQLLAMASKIMAEEAALQDYKRLKARSWMEIKFGGLLECCEKGTIVGEFGKLVISEISEEPTQPGLPRSVYMNHAKIQSILTDALSCVESVVFTSFSPPPDSASVFRSHSRSSSVASSPSVSSESTNDSSFATFSDIGSPPNSATTATSSRDASVSPEPLKNKISSTSTSIIVHPPSDHILQPTSDPPSRSTSARTINPREGSRFAAFPVKKRRISTSKELSTTLRVPTPEEPSGFPDMERRNSAVFIGNTDSTEFTNVLQSNSSVGHPTTLGTPSAVFSRPTSVMVDIDRHLSSIPQMEDPWPISPVNDILVLNGPKEEMDSFSSAVAAALSVHVSKAEGVNADADKAPSIPTSPRLVVETALSEERAASRQSEDKGKEPLSTAETHATLPSPQPVSPLIVDSEDESAGESVVEIAVMQPPVVATEDLRVPVSKAEPLEEPATPRARTSPELSSEMSPTFGVRFSPIVIEIKRPVSLGEESVPETPRATSPPPTSTLTMECIASQPSPPVELIENKDFVDAAMHMPPQMPLKIRTDIDASVVKKTSPVEQKNPSPITGRTLPVRSGSPIPRKRRTRPKTPPFMPDAFISPGSPKSSSRRPRFYTTNPDPSPSASPSSSSSSVELIPALVVDTNVVSEQRLSSQNESVEGTGSLPVTRPYSLLPFPQLVSPLTVNSEDESTETAITEGKGIQFPVAVDVAPFKPESVVDSTTPLSFLSPDKPSESSSSAFGVRFSPIVVEIKRPASVSDDGVPETPRIASPTSAMAMSMEKRSTGPEVVSSVEPISTKETIVPSQVEVSKVVVQKPSATGAQNNNSGRGSPVRARSPATPSRQNSRSRTPPVMSSRSASPAISKTLRSRSSTTNSISPPASTPISPISDSPAPIRNLITSAPTLSSQSFVSTPIPNIRRSQSDDLRPSQVQSQQKYPFPSGPAPKLVRSLSSVKKPLPSSPYPQHRTAESGAGAVVLSSPFSRPIPSSFARPVSLRSMSVPASVSPPTLSKNSASFP